MEPHPQEIIAEAEYRLALAYLKGEEGTVQNTALALTYLQQSAEKGHLYAKQLLSQQSTDKRVFYPKGLIHQTASGDRVRSKSEVIIADALFYNGVPFSYEREWIIEGDQVLSPDFTIDCLTGEMLIWEHLGLISDPIYRDKWFVKRAIYASKGWIEGKNLFITQDGVGGSINSKTIFDIVLKIKPLRLSINRHTYP